MLGIIALLVISIAVTLFVRSFSSHFEKTEATVITGLLCIVVSGFMAIPAIKWTGGFYPGYSEGERVGYITQASRKGVIFKTNEIQMQIGTGEMAALQEPHPFSVPNQATFDNIKQNLGRKCRIQYSQWLAMPYHTGSSNYEVTSVEWLEDARK